MSQHLKAMPVYKLTYFDCRCKAELARLMFVYQGQKFEDITVSHDEWPNYQSKTPFGQVPTLEIDGKVYGESVAINNHLARQFGLYGQTDVQKFEIDQVVGITQDMWKYIIDWIHDVMDMEAKAPSKGQLKSSLEKVNEETIFPKYLTCLEKILKDNGTGFYVGNKLSYADLAVFDVLDIQFPESLLDKYSLVKANRDMVKNHDKLKEYIATRKENRW